MDYPVVLLAKTSGSFLAAFLAIWVWTRIREEGWALLVLGTLIQFAVLLLEVLLIFGILSLEGAPGRAVPLWFGILQALPYLFYSMGFGFFVYRNRHY